MLSPFRTKFKRYHKKKIKFFEYKPTSTYRLVVGALGIQALESALVTPQQLETVRRTIIRRLPHRCRIWFKVFPDQIFTVKPKEVRMGRGKGDLKNYVFKVKKSRIVLEVTGYSSVMIVPRLKLAIRKLPFLAKIVYRGL